MGEMSDYYRDQQIDAEVDEWLKADEEESAHEAACVAALCGLNPAALAGLLDACEQIKCAADKGDRVAELVASEKMFDALSALREVGK